MNDFVIENNILKDYKGPGGVVVIPDGVTAIGRSAFRRSTSVTEIIIPDSVISISKNAFADCRKLESITIPASVKQIDKDIFDYCVALKRINISDLALWCAPELSMGNSHTIHTITSDCPPYDLYLNGELVTDLVIPDSVTEIRYDAFRNCRSITSVVIPSSVTSIASSVFAGCKSIEKVMIPESVETIGREAFAGCKSLKEVIIPESVKAIKDKAFYNCSGLESINVNSSVKELGDNILKECPSLKKICTDSMDMWFLLTYRVDSSANAEYYINGELLCDSMIPEFFISNGKLLKYFGDDEAVIIPDSVTEIGGGAFSFYSKLKSITIPSSVKSIAKYTFSDCKNLQEVHISSIETWCNIEFDGYGSNPLMHDGRLYLNGELITDLVIPDSVTVIPKNTFANCSSITSLTVPDSVISIEEDAFYACENLKYINISDSVKSIAHNAFYFCPLITFYYVVENDCIIKKYASSLPLDIEKIYADARFRYTIIYHHSDWANDTGDNGMGYEYNNSYTTYREPQRSELLIRNGELHGFIVCGIDKPLLINGQTKTVYDGGHGSPRYGSGDSWTLEEDHCVAKYMRIPNMAADSEKYKFSPKDFPAGLVSKIIKQVGDEDSYGDFNGRFAVTVELTENAVADLDATLENFLSFKKGCVLLKKP